MNLPGHEPNGAVDRLLAKALRAEAAAQGCVEPEVLAAFVEDGLTAPGRARVEAHLAACGRCQEIIATLLRTEDHVRTTRAADAGRARPRFLVPIRWLVPFAGAAAAAALFIATRPERAPTSPASSAVAEENARSRAEQQTARQAPDEDRKAAPAASADAPMKQIERDLRKEKTAPSARSDSATKNAALKDSAEREALDRTAPAAPPPARPAAVTLQSSLTAPVVITAADASTLWRVAGQDVQRSTDRGGTWTTVLSATGVRLAAGSCPTATVCWLVGSGGAVFRMTDGLEWQRISMGEAVDLTSVRAVDGDTAVVTASDGRVFTTHDGGRTWSR